MRIETVRFGVRTNKTIRRVGQKRAMICEVGRTILSKSNEMSQVKLYDGKLFKSKNNFE